MQDYIFKNHIIEKQLDIPKKITKFMKPIKYQEITKIVHFTLQVCSRYLLKEKEQKKKKKLINEQHGGVLVETGDINEV